jgi:hypothetical protein
VHKVKQRIVGPPGVSNISEAFFRILGVTGYPRKDESHLDFGTQKLDSGLASWRRHSSTLKQIAKVINTVLPVKHHFLCLIFSFLCAISLALSFDDFL